MKKITVIEIITILIVLIALAIYLAPNFIHSKETRKIAQIKAMNAIFTAKTLEEFAKDTNAKPSDIAKKVTDELNKTNKNPFDKKQVAYTFEKECTGCNIVSYDDDAKMVVVTAHNPKGELVARTIIKPPSFVEYSKLDDKK